MALIAPPAPPGDRPAPQLPGLRLPEPAKRIGGGYETDVYRSPDGRLAFKLKRAAGPPAAMLARARLLAAVAHAFQRHLGPRHSLPGDYLLVAARPGAAQVLAVQPFLDGARPLDVVPIAALPPADRAAMLRQLHEIVDGALRCYRATGYLPDLYGLGPHVSDLARRHDPGWLLSEAWRLLAGRPLLSAHNLLLAPDGRVVLVDCDPLCAGTPLCRLVYGARALLLLRDRRQLGALLRAAEPPGGP